MENSEVGNKRQSVGKQSELRSKRRKEEKKSKQSNGEAQNPNEQAQQSAEPMKDPPLSAAFRRRIRPILDRIDDLRAHGLQNELQMPMVAVVGDQSVGKSSVLEAISAIELPRGTGIVTRCPLQLSMRSVTNEKPWKGHISYKTLEGQTLSKDLHDPSEVDAAVREAQQLMTKDAGAISEEQINLSIESSTVPDLTLLDLPGIARFSSTSGQSIETITKSLISKYITQPQVLILVVVPCHVDIETVEALSLAKSADPKGERTVGVMTCPDMVNKGAEAETLKIAFNQKIPLQKGYVMVKCRNPQELQDKVTLDQCQQLEEQFFMDHSHFSQLPSTHRGIRTLATKLSEELLLSVKRNIPILQKEILDLRKKYQDELSQLGMSLADTPQEKLRFLNEMVNNFSVDLRIATRGEMNSQFQLFSRCRKLWEKLGSEIEQARPNWIQRSSADYPFYAPNFLKTSVQQSRGREPPSYDYIFPTIEKVFRDNFLSNIRDPAFTFLEACSDAVMQVLKSIAQSAFNGFNDLIDVVMDKSTEEMESIIDEARGDLERLFNQESRVFTQDKVFLYKMKKIEEDLYKNTSQQTRDDHQTPDSEERIRRGLEAYLDIACERLADTIPQSVLYHMLDITADRICSRAVDLTTDAEQYLPMIREDQYKTFRRKHLQGALEQLRFAQRDFNAFRTSVGAASAAAAAAGDDK